MKNYSFKNIFLKNLGQLFLIGLISLTMSCKDEPARLTGDVLPEGEKIQGLVYDGHVLSTRNIARDSVRTSDAKHGVIGTFNDPVFGKTKADFLTDFSIGKEVKFSIKYIAADGKTEKDTVLYKFNNNSTDFPNDTWEVDKLVLNLPYNYSGWYGDMLVKQNIKIHELLEGLGSNSKKYYSDHKVTGMYNVNHLAEKMVHPNDDIPDSLRNGTHWPNIWHDPKSLWGDPQYLWDVAKVDTVMDKDFNRHKQVVHSWDFNLVNEDIANRFFNFEEKVLKSTAAFKESFLGLYITSDELTTEEGSLTKINLLSGMSSLATNLTIHLSRKHKYKNAQDEIRDTTSLYTYSFPINVENVRFNRYDHTLNESNIDTLDMTPQKLYIQGMAGAYTRMQLPEEIINWADSIGDPASAKPLSGEEFGLVSNIEFFMEIDTTHYEPMVGMDRYPIPEQLAIKWMNEKNELDNPIYTIIVNGRKISSPIFGSDADQEGRRTGIGERVIRKSEDGKTEYLYRFILRADYFNYIMRNEDGGELDKKQFYIGPASTTSNFQRVVLFGGANDVRPMKMNIKYFKYQVR